MSRASAWTVCHTLSCDRKASPAALSSAPPSSWSRSVILTMLPRYLKAMDVHVNLTERLQLEGGAELKSAGEAFRSQLKVWQTVQADARDMAHKLDAWQT